MQPLESSTNHPAEQGAQAGLGSPTLRGGDSFSMPFFQRDYSEILDLALLCLFSFSE